MPACLRLTQKRCKRSRKSPKPLSTSTPSEPAGVPSASCQPASGDHHSTQAWAWRPWKIRVDVLSSHAPPAKPPTTRAGIPLILKSSVRPAAKNSQCPWRSRSKTKWSWCLGDLATGRWFSCCPFSWWCVGSIYSSCWPNCCNKNSTSNNSRSNFLSTRWSSCNSVCNKCNRQLEFRWRLRWQRWNKIPSNNSNPDSNFDRKPFPAKALQEAQKRKPVDETSVFWLWVSFS